MQDQKKVLLAYSGGLDTSVILKWLLIKGYEVYCYIGDVGQKEDFKKAEEKALAIGATKVFIDNLQKELIEEYAFLAMQFHAKYEGTYLLGTSLARPLIAKGMAQKAKEEGIKLFSHGATGKGNDQVRFELSLIRLIPDAVMIAPWRESEFIQKFKGRNDLIAYAKEHKIPVTATLKKPYSVDENLIHTSFEGGEIENLAYAPDEEMFIKTISPLKAPDKPSKIKLTFQKGRPVKLIGDDKKTYEDALELFNYLNDLAGKHAIGREDLIESRFLGMKSRGIYETPALTVLMKAHQDLEGLVQDREVRLLKEEFSVKWAELVYKGFWKSPEFEFLTAALNQSQKCVNGEIELLLYKGNCIIQSRSSENSLYNQKRASMDEEGDFDQQDATGFINIEAVRLRGRN